MELFTGGREAFTFPQHVAPFPELTAMIESAEDSMMGGDQRPNLPAQKLRPIRYNGRSPASSQAEDPSEFTGVGEVVGEEVCPVNADYLEPPIKAEGGDGDDVVDTGGGNGPEKLEPSSSSSSSSDSDDANDLSATLDEPLNRKRKRKTRKKMELFLEKLVMKVMEKQEQMHKQLMEMIENRERERIIREEAWKRQEITRIKRDQEARAQETSRSIALISFIQNVLGHEIEIPIQTTIPCMEENGGKDMIGEDHIQKESIGMCDPINRWHGGKMQANNGGENHIHNIHRDVGINCDPNNRRWPDAEVQALIMLRSALDHKFHVAGSKCSVWDEISIGMYNMGYHRNAKKCKEKWENINKYFRKSMGSGRKHLENSKRCPYFHELNLLYKHGLVSPANHVNRTNDENEDRVKGSQDQT